MEIRTGIGYDIHRLEEGHRLILGGTEIEYNKGLVAHSDGDALLHAISDAILGALAMGDIGMLYPDTSAETRDMDSKIILREIIERISDSWDIVNIDSNIICQQPKLSPYRDSMRQQIAQTCGIELERVSVKFRTNEKVDSLGRGESIATQANVLLQRKE